MKKLILMLLAVLGVSLLVVSCAGPLAGQAIGDVCTRDNQCGAGEKCVNGKCAAMVTTTTSSSTAISSATCTGTAPANAQLCSGDSIGLTASTPIKIVSACSSVAKCEYTCNSGFQLQTGSCRSTPSPPPSPSVCGNNKIESGEECDGTDVGSGTCKTGYTGVVKCKDDCLNFDYSGCVAQSYCQDSDNPTNDLSIVSPFFILGSVTSSDSPDGINDSCAASGGKVVLIEGVCINNKYAYNQKKCAEMSESMGLSDLLIIAGKLEKKSELGKIYGCDSGRCYPVNCFDTDDQNFEVKGKVIAPGGYSQGIDDSCFSGLDVSEWTCENNKAKVVQKKCSDLGKGYTCDNGACVPPKK